MLGNQFCELGRAENSVVILHTKPSVGTRGLGFCHYFSAVRQWLEKLPPGFAKLTSSLVGKKTLNQKVIFELEGGACRAIEATEAI